MKYVIIFDKYIMNNYWNNVRSELSFQGKTQIELADYIGLSIGTLRNKMNLQALPTFETAIKISEFLNVTMEYLLTGNNFTGLNDDEMEVIRLYKSLKPENKSMVKQLLAALSVE